MVEAAATNSDNSERWSLPIKATTPPLYAESNRAPDVRLALSSAPRDPTFGGRVMARPGSALRGLSVTRPAQMLAMSLGHQPGLFTYLQPQNLVRDGPNAATNLRFRPTYEN